MENRRSFSILVGMASIFLLISCEKAEIQKSQTKIHDRTSCIEECDDCPVNDCCCVLTQITGQVDLVFCGTTEPCLTDIPCSSTIGTCMISGFERPTSLNAMGLNRREFFCVSPGVPFSIQPTMGSGTATLSCQYNVPGAQVINITWSSPNKVAYTADSDCLLTSCL